jgi:hypothetical protein
MTSFALSLLLAALVPPSQESKPIPNDSVEVEAQGCLKGRVFTAIPPPEEERTRKGPDITGRHFRVAGPREVTDQVKRHNGHLVQVVGIVRKADLSAPGMKVGGGRVTIAPGDPTRMGAGTTAPSMPVMDLTAVRYLSDRCPIG